MGKHMDITLAHVRWLNSGGAAGRNQMVKLMIVKVHCSTWSFRPSWGVLWETYIGRKPTSLEHRHVFSGVEPSETNYIVYFPESTVY